jgi:hypothetical protein
VFALVPTILQSFRSWRFRSSEFLRLSLDGETVVFGAEMGTTAMF